MIHFDSLFSSFQLPVLVIGDVMLDTYWWGNTERISPEAPVPVVAVSKKEQRIGGAGNVALNLVSLGARVSLVSLVGNDDEASQLKDLLDANKINSAYLCQSKERGTTNKIRIISRNQHMMRLDAEVTKDLSAAEESLFLQNVEAAINAEKPAVVIFEDYNKGVLTHTAIQKIIARCKELNIATTVDPKRKNFFSYTGVDVFKPNLREAKEALNIIEPGVSQPLLHHIHKSLQAKLGHDTSFITLSENGVYYCNDSEESWVPTHARNIADVSGAGDTVIAVASLVFAATKNRKLMAEMANIAGGIVCEEVGTVAINKETFLAECKRLLS